MRDIIKATLGGDHFIKCQTYTIARNGEGLTPCLSVAIPENLCKYWAYIDFKKPNGETFKTPRIDVVEGILEYNIPCAVLDVDGKLYLQIIFQNELSEIWKSYVKEFVVRESINAVDDIPKKEDFITEAQKVIDEAEATAKSIEERANNGEFDGEKGEKGDSYVLTETDKTEILETLLKLESRFIKLSDNLINPLTFTERVNLQPATGQTLYLETCKVCDYVPVEAGTSYIIKENQTVEITGSKVRYCAYDSSYNFIKILYEENRTRIGQYYHPFEIPINENIAYIRAQFRITDQNIEMYKTQNVLQNKLQETFYNDNSYTQGMCVTDNYAFISCSPSKNADKNDYVIRKVDLTSGEILATSTQAYNHANGITYNKNTNKLYVCALDGNAETTTTISDDDYSLYVVDVDTLSLVDTINLKNIITTVCVGSVGISGVTYNPQYDEYYVLTRHPKRYIITLDNSFNLKDFFFMFDRSADNGVRGDICTDGYWIYCPNWRSDLATSNSLINEVHVYSRKGELIGVFTVNGYTHIESMDIKDGYYYFNFIDFSDNRAKTIKTNGIFNLSQEV